MFVLGVGKKGTAHDQEATTEIEDQQVTIKTQNMIKIKTINTQIGTKEINMISIIVKMRNMLKKRGTQMRNMTRKIGTTIKMTRMVTKMTNTQKMINIRGRSATKNDTKKQNIATMNEMI